MNKGRNDCIGFEFNVSKGDDSTEIIRTLKNMCEAKGEQCHMSCCDSDQFSRDKDYSCEDMQFNSKHDMQSMQNGMIRDKKEETKKRKERQKEENKTRKQLVKECKKKAKEIAKEYKKKEKERQQKEKERRKKIKEYEKKKAKQEKQCKKERNKCEKDSEKERKRQAKEKLKRLKDRMKMKCDSLKYAHQNDEECEEDNINCCQQAAARINGINQYSKQGGRNTLGG